VKVISRHGVGMERIDLAAAAELGIRVTNTPQANSVSVAEHVVALMLALAKNVRTLDRATRSGAFELRHTCLSVELRGKVLGIVGLGKVGSQLARIASLGLGMKILAFDPCQSMPMAGVELASSWDRLFALADFVSLNLPLNPETRGIVGMREFRLMKASAYLINCSRAELVNEAELIQALREKVIAGAGLDVFAHEPPAPDNPLLCLDNVVLTPHTAAHTRDAMINMATHAAQGIIEVLSGRQPSWPVPFTPTETLAPILTAAHSHLIRNREQLLDHGQRTLRKHALEVIETGICAADPGAGTRKLVKLDGEVLYVGPLAIAMADVDRVYVVGVGKASWPIAAALEEILGSRIAGGLVVVKRGEQRPLKRIEVHQAGHPIPDAYSVEAARKMLRFAEQAGPRDVVLAPVTGGASALVTLPPAGLDLGDIQAITDLLLRSGATIREINMVRRHLCRLKGGRFVSLFQPAHVVTLTLNTAPDGSPWPDLCLPDPTTFEDAIDVLQQLRLWPHTPAAVREYLERSRGNSELETVKSFEGFRATLVHVGDPESACEAAARRAGELGYTPVILSTRLEGEAKDVGIMLAGIAGEIVSRGRPFRPPCALISGGETTVTVGSATGRGGPNLETAVAFATRFSQDAPVVLACVDTDGDDGPTDVAGGIVDAHSRSRAVREDADLDALLHSHDSLSALAALGDAIITGQTGVNVMNLRVLLIGGNEEKHNRG
jgi:glycerate-2-kinase/phosphoglycerate dehydrogenase-like enzyme